ncbi:MAG: hypothetical protein ACRD33_00160 [Candidatus Acidiferrales bacterium]
MITVKLMTLSVKFAELRQVEVSTDAEARALIEAHAASGGYRNVKRVEDGDQFRYTATTPGGRAGRNIAFIDMWQSYEHS